MTPSCPARVALQQHDVAFAEVLQRRFGLGARQRQRAGAGADDAVLAVGQHHEQGEVGGMRQARQQQLGEAFARRDAARFRRPRHCRCRAARRSAPNAASRRHDRLVQSLAAGRARAGAADQRLAGQRQARHGQAQIQPGIADDDDASPPLRPVPPPRHPLLATIPIPVHYGRALEEDRAMKKTYHGSCHCGRVRFEADIDLEAGTRPLQLFDLHQAAGVGRDHQAAGFSPDLGQGRASATTSSTRRQGHHRFCNTCGIAPFGDGEVKEIGGAFVSINVACLDDVTPEELARLPISIWTAGTTTGLSLLR